MLVASTTGVSAIIAPDGSLIAHSGIWQPAVLDARVPLRTSLTLADRLGSWPEDVITFLVLAALAWAIAGAAAGARGHDATAARSAIDRAAAGRAARRYPGECGRRRLRAVLRVPIPCSDDGGGIAVPSAGTRR